LSLPFRNPWTTIDYELISQGTQRVYYFREILPLLERVNDMGVLEPQGACQRIYVGAGCWEVEFSDVSGYL
jgi:hypothetical protein